MKTTNTIQKKASRIIILFSLLIISNKSDCSQQLTTSDAFFLGFIAGIGTAFYLTSTITNTVKATERAAIEKKEAEIKTALARKAAADSIAASNRETERVRLEEMAKLAQTKEKIRQEAERVRLEEMAKRAIIQAEGYQKLMQIRQETEEALQIESRKQQRQQQIEIRKQQIYKQAAQEAKNGNLEKAYALLQTDRPLSPQISLV